MEWPLQRAVERQAIRMHQMMDRLEVDAVAFVRLRKGEVYAEARSRCLSCNQTDACLRWLDRRYGSNTGPEFCPALELFAPCRPATRTAAALGQIEAERSNESAEAIKS